MYLEETCTSKALIEKQESLKVGDCCASLKDPGEGHQSRKKEIRRIFTEINGMVNVLQKFKPKHDSGIKVMKQTSLEPGEKIQYGLKSTSTKKNTKEKQKNTYK